MLADENPRHHQPLLSGPRGRRVCLFRPLLFDLTIQGDGGEAHTVEEWIREQYDRRCSFGRFLEEGLFAAALHPADLFLITEKHGSGASFIPSIQANCLKHAGEYTRQFAIARMARLLQKLNQPGWKAPQRGSAAAQLAEIGPSGRASQS